MRRLIVLALGLSGFGLAGCAGGGSANDPTVQAAISAGVQATMAAQVPTPAPALVSLQSSDAPSDATSTPVPAPKEGRLIGDGATTIAIANDQGVLVDLARAINRNDPVGQLAVLRQRRLFGVAGGTKVVIYPPELPVASNFRSTNTVGDNAIQGLLDLGAPLTPDVVGELKALPAGAREQRLRELLRERLGAQLPASSQMAAVRILEGPAIGRIGWTFAEWVEGS